MNNHQHNHDDIPTQSTLDEPGETATLELEITNYFMGSTCPNIEHHVTATEGVHTVALSRTTGIIEVGYDPSRVTPDTIIEAVKHCGFICQEGGPVHLASHTDCPLKYTSTFFLK